MSLVNGLVVMTPSSISYSGTSASINADGSVQFNTVSSLSLNGVFTGDYDNYMVSMYRTSSANTGPRVRLRAGGTDYTSANYVSQDLYATNGAVSGGRATYQFMQFGAVGTTSGNGITAYFFGPYLAQPTAKRTLCVYSQSDASIMDSASILSTSSSYDGLTVYQTSGNFTGLITVFGFNQ